ncbi:hypothetical protein [Enhygromyxa salina]|uniref:hypothetical protein n=1 Tax=Enhygromyxa salina TaxID=215803 RepID=UPI0006988F6D|nr:hypothetical protein [Enhygromyxa salina]
MATPDVVQFVCLSQDPRTVIEALGGALDTLDTELAAIARLGYDTEDGRFGFEGQEQRCTNFAVAGAQVADWGDIALQLLLPPGGGACFVYLWRQRETTCLSVELHAGNLYFESEEWENLQWVRSFLIATNAALGTVGSAYDAHRDELFAPLNLGKILEALRAGTLLETVPLSHYMIRHDVIAAREIRALVERDAPPGFRYSETTTGYYVLDNLY